MKPQNGSRVAMTVKTAISARCRLTNGRIACLQVPNAPSPSIRVASSSATGMRVVAWSRKTRLKPATSQLPNHRAYAAGWPPVRLPTMNSAGAIQKICVARIKRMKTPRVGSVANAWTEVTGSEQLHDLLGRSILYTAAISYLRDEPRLATLGSYCQRLGRAACRSAQAPLIQASAALRVPAADRYNTAGFTTWLKQPLATILLAVASLLLGALASLIVAVLPFLLGIAKAIAILMSSVGLWIMLWPGRFWDALSWMVLPVAFVALWSLLFNLWAEVETFLTVIASVVSHSDYGSFSAGRIMSIAISIGYLGLPAIASAAACAVPPFPAAPTSLVIVVPTMRIP